jgi:hypothetical protein
MVVGVLYYLNKRDEYKDAEEASSTPDEGVCREDVPSLLLGVLSEVEESRDAVE